MKSKGRSIAMVSTAIIAALLLWFLRPVGVPASPASGPLLDPPLYCDAKSIEAAMRQPPTCDIVHEGDLIIDGNQEFVIENCVYCQTGNVEVFDNARLVLRNTTIVFNQSYHEEFGFWFHDSSSLEMENASIESSYTYIFRIGDHSTAQVISSNLSDAYIPLFGNASLSISASNVGHIELDQWRYGTQASDFVTLSLSGSTLHELSLATGFSPTVTMTALRPGYYDDWNLYRDNEVQDLPMDITLLESTVEFWDFAIAGSATFIFDDCEISQLGSDEQASVTVRDSTIGQAVLTFHQGQTIELNDLSVGYVAHWSLQNLSPDPNLQFEYTVENSVINGWYLRIKGADVTIRNSHITRLRPEFDTSTSETQVINSRIDELMLWWHHGIVTFDESTVTTVLNPDESTSRIRGSVDFINEEISTAYGPWGNSTITREFPLLTLDASNAPLPGVDLKLYSPQNTLVWSGVSDSEGEAAFELAFDDSDYQATWTLIASRFGCGVAEIKLLLDTPVELCILFGDYDCDRDVDVADICVP